MPDSNDDADLTVESRYAAQETPTRVLVPAEGSVMPKTRAVNSVFVIGDIAAKRQARAEAIGKGRAR